MRAVHRSLRRMLTLGTVIAVLAIPAVGAVAADDEPQIGFVSGLNPLEPDSELYVSEADGTGRAGLTAGFGTRWHWAWSPDGSRVAFFSGADGDEDLFVRELGETLPLVVAGGADPDEGWAWSPDSTRIAFVSPQDGDIYVTDVESGTIINVSNDSRGSSRPRWSPAGSHIAYDVFWEDHLPAHLVSSCALYIISCT